MATFTGKEQSVEETKRISQAFTRKVNLLLRKKIYNNHKLGYFSNIEFGSDPIDNPNIHAHIQCFIDSLQPLKDAFDYVIEKFGLDSSKCDLSIANNHELDFTYVIKNYLSENFDEEFEEMKDELYRGEAMCSSSQKEIPNYLIKRLYALLSRLPEWAAIRNKYAYIIDLAGKGIVSIKKVSDGMYDGYKKLKKWIYNIDYKRLLIKTDPYTIDDGTPSPEKNKFFSILVFLSIVIFALWMGSGAPNLSKMDHSPSDGRISMSSEYGKIGYKKDITAYYVP